MLDVSGNLRLRYADAFRAIGHYLDSENFNDVTIVETPDGFVLTGHALMLTQRGPAIDPRTYLFADPDIDTLIEQAYARRDQPLPENPSVPAVLVGRERVRYEDVLRCVGALIEERSWHAVTTVQAQSGFLVKGFHIDKTYDEFLGASDLRRMLDELPHRRKTGWRKRWPW